ncbi:hypothetical protein FFI87_020175 [Burkholderia sp. KBS0801]|nr:hypothetical protein FFI87_020175 [Burkholderia sp. KBS0801]
MTRRRRAPCRSRDRHGETLRDQRLRSRMLRISTCLPTKIVDKRAIGRVHRAPTAVIACGGRCAGLPARFEAARTKPFGSSACAWYAQAIHTLANKICGQAAWRA